MSKNGKISTIKREISEASGQTMDSSLSKRGMIRVPGTGVFKYPYKELDGKYRTGLDENAAYIQRMFERGQKLEAEAEIERIREARPRLEKALDVDLGPRSTFWNCSLSKGSGDVSHAQPVKLTDGDNYFDLSVPFQEVLFSYTRVHPTIASSHQAWERGDYPADTQFYVVDEDVENKVIFKKKQLINKAIVKLDDMTPEKKRKVARQLGLPVSEDTKEEVVYNLIDNLLKQTEFKTGKYAGLDPVKVFLDYADMKEQILHIKDLIKQALMHSIYRVKSNGKIMEGETEVAVDEDELVKYLIKDENQEELISLENKLKFKKLMNV